MLVTLSILSSIQDGIMAFLLALDGIVYKVVGWLYQVFIAISSARIFSNETFEVFEQRIYIILGIAMLFVLAYSLLQSIANPDEMNKGSFSAGKIVINTVTSLVLIAIMPTLFDFAYEAQRILMNQNIVGKIILGSYSSTSPKINVTYDDQAACDTLGQSSTPCTVSFSGTAENELELAGNSIAVDIFSSFYYPNPAGSVQTDNSINLYEITYNDLKNADTDFTEKAQEVYKNISNYNQCGAEGESAYIYGEAAEKCALASGATNTSNYDERNILYRSILQYAKTTGDFSGFSLTHKLIGEDIMEYTFIISTIAGGFCCYILASYCLDMGLRAAKLGFAQLIAPIPILARIIPKQSSMFDSWLKFTTSTFIQVFIKIAILFFGIFMVTNIPDTWDMISSSSLFTLSLMSFKTPVILDLNASYGVVAFARVVVIIGILMFMKQATNLVTEALGINVNAGSLNIRNKLRGMVGGDKMLSGASKVAGATTGAIGAGYMSKRNGGSFFRAALKGGHDGAQGGGNQFFKQGQQTYHDLTGDKYNGSFLRRGRSFMGNVEFQYDRSNRQLQAQQKQHLENVVKDFEQSDEYKSLKTAQMAVHRAELEKIRTEQQNANGQAYRVQQQAIADAKAKEQQDIREAENYKTNEAQAIANRMRAYEQTNEYRNAHRQAYNDAYSAIEKQMKQNGEDKNFANAGAFGAEVAKRAQEELKNNKDYIKNAVAASNSEQAKKYIDDITRDVNKEADDMIQKAKKDAQDKISNAQNVYRDSLEKARQDAQKATKDIDDIVDKEVQDAIKKNPKGRAQVEYANAQAELSRQGQARDDQQLRRVLDQVYNKGNKK